MSLPIVKCPTREVEGVTVRGLTRAEALAMRVHGEDLEAIEIAMLAGGTDTAMKDTRAWYKTAPAALAGTLIAAITDLTGLDDASPFGQHAIERGLMLGEIDPLDFVLAENLGMSLSQIRDLPNAEIVQWRAFNRFRAEMQKLHG